MDTTVGVVVFCGEANGPPDYVVARRVVPDDGAPLRAALEQLLLGVTPQEAEAGLASSFSSFTAGQVVEVELLGDVATIEWSPGWVTTNNFSTSNVSGIVLSQVAATVFQFENVDGIDFLVDGERWCGWETTCEGIPAPRISRADFAPPECVDAWRTGGTAPIHCQDLVAAYVITVAAERTRDDSLLLRAEDVGTDFSEVDVDAVSSPCSLSISTPPRTAERSFVSNAAQQAIGQRVLTFVDAQSASEAFAEAESASACEASEFGDAGGAPTSVEIEGADEAFSINFADSNDAAAITVARHAEHIVVLETTIHHGPTTSDPVGMHQLMAQAISRLK